MILSMRGGWPSFGNPVDNRINIMILVYYVLLLLFSIISIDENVVSPFWLDEVFTGAMSCQPSFSEALPLMEHNLHPILYQMLVYFLFHLAGCNLWLVRCVSLVCSISAALLLLLTIRRRQGNVLLASSFIFGNPVFWMYAFEARAYSLLFLCGACVAVFGTSRRDRSLYAALAWALFGSALHYYGCGLFALLAVIVVSGDSGLKKSGKFWSAFAFCILLTGIYYACQVKFAIAASAGLQWIGPSQPLSLLFMILGIFGCIPSSVIANGFVAAGIFITIRLGNVGRNRQWLWVAAFCYSVILVLFSASYIKPMFIYRYIYFSQPALVLSAALLLQDSRSSSAGGKGQFASVIPMLLIISLVYNVTAVTKSFSLVRVMNWQHAIKSMDCLPEAPCAFVLDDPALPSFNDLQYFYIANFLANRPRSFMPVRPKDLLEWLHDYPDRQVLYVRSFAPQIRISKTSLVCGTQYLNEQAGGMPCHAGNRPASDENR